MSPHYYKELLEDDEPKSLGDWVRNFRVKKNQMKRRVRAGADLRICAILTTALLNAEHELRRKQQERFNRWLDYQTKLRKEYHSRRYPTKATIRANAKMRMMSSQVNVNVMTVAPYTTTKYESTKVECANIQQKDNEKIKDLWRCELNSLDEFMRSISSKSQNCSPPATALSTANAIGGEKLLTKENGEGGDVADEQKKDCDRNNFKLVAASPAIKESSSLIMTT